MQIVVDGLLTSYQLSGKGPLILILHGWGDSSQGSLALQAELAGAHQILAIDLPGFGGTQPPPTAWGLNEYAAFVAAVLDKLQLRLEIIIGHSNGGAIAIRGLSAGTLHAKKLVLLASAGIRNQYQGRNKALRLVTKTAKLLSKPLPGRVQNRLRTRVYHAIGSDMLVAEHLQETFKLIVNDDVQADTERIKIPTLLIYGLDDTATPVHYGELLQAGLVHADLHVVPNAGHFVYLDQPKAVIKVIKEFI